MKVYAVFNKVSGVRYSKWYTRFGDAKAQTKWYGNDAEARECFVSFSEPHKPSIPQLEDFEICSVKREKLTHDGVYVEIELKNKHDVKLILKGGYED